MNERWLALEQGTQHHHQQIDQMMKMLRLIRGEQNNAPVLARRSSFRGGASQRALLQPDDATNNAEDRSRATQLRFAGFLVSFTLFILSFT